MGTFIIEGGKPLYGTVTVSGSKNAALPVIFASLITIGVSEIINLPDIDDVRSALEIISDFGAVIRHMGNTTYIDTRELEYKKPNPSLVSKLRASTYLIGSCLCRFGRAELQSFGGCNFSHRPIDMHISSAQAFGAVMKNESLSVCALRPADVIFDKRSVGATVNTLILATGTDGVSSVYGYSREPHINTLIDYLSSAGAYIEERDDFLNIKGGKLGGGRVYIPGDMIEAGTYLSLATVTGGCVRVLGADPLELKPFLLPLSSGGAEVRLLDKSITLRGRVKESLEIITAPYPAFPTDLQPIIAPLLARNKGGSITDTVWEGRFGYLSELAKFGIHSSVRGNTAEIFPSDIHSATAAAVDLRGGASCILAALAAEGVSRIENAEILGRGYERLTEKLCELGAEIKLIEE